MAGDLTVTRDGDMLVIRIPIKTATPSASGKTLVVASTRGSSAFRPDSDDKTVAAGRSIQSGGWVPMPGMTQQGT
jgi:hypothetical protein